VLFLGDVYYAAAIVQWSEASILRDSSSLWDMPFGCQSPVEHHMSASDAISMARKRARRCDLGVPKCGSVGGFCIWLKRFALERPLKDETG
jgi:hypothetical protein